MASEEDPEAARVDELLERQLQGTGTEAESEELALYAEDRPELRARIEEQVARGALGQGWLDRVRKDDAIAKLETSGRARAERIGGAALALTGWVLTYVVPTVGLPLGAIGIALILYSVIRVRLATHASDPYKDVVR